MYIYHCERKVRRPFTSYPNIVNFKVVGLYFKGLLKDGGHTNVLLVGFMLSGEGEQVSHARWGSAQDLVPILDGAMD